MQDDTYITVWPTSHNLTRTPVCTHVGSEGHIIRSFGLEVKNLQHTLVLNKGDVLYFRGDMLHAGGAFDNRNIRVFGYADNPNVPRRADATYPAEFFDPAYISQSTHTCGSHVEQACGPVSLINALIHLDTKLTGKLIPEEVIAIAKHLCLFDGGGLPPAKFAQLCVHVCSKWGYTATFHETCAASLLTPGMLLYVSSVELMNAQGCDQFELPVQDSHVVMLEEVRHNGTLVVINPDRKLNLRNGEFIEDTWGRMLIPKSSIEKVWKTVRHDNTRTTHCAIAIRKSDASARLLDIEKGEEIRCVYGYDGSWDLTLPAVKGKKRKNPVSKQQGPKRRSRAAHAAL